MLDINWNLYKVFCTVAKSKNYAEAAEKLNISVSTISIHIKNLEDILNIKLFHRGNDGIRLTERGEELFEILNNGMESINIAEKMVNDKNDLSNGEVSIACPSHLTAYLLMDSIEEVKKDYPMLDVKVRCGSNFNEMIELLENHKIDFLITDMLPNTSKDIVVKEIKEINNIFVSKQPIKIKEIKELEKYNYITNFNDTNTVINLIKKLKEYNVNISSKMECDTTEIRVDAVKRNLGIGYIMKEAVKNELENQELYEVEIPIKLPTVKINLIYKKGYLTKADKEFIKKYLKI